MKPIDNDIADIWIGDAYKQGDREVSRPADLRKTCDQCIVTAMTSELRHGNEPDLTPEEEKAQVERLLKFVADYRIEHAIEPVAHSDGCKIEID